MSANPRFLTAAEALALLKPENNEIYVALRDCPQGGAVAFDSSYVSCVRTIAASFGARKFEVKVDPTGEYVVAIKNVTISGLEEKILRHLKGGASIAVGTLANKVRPASGDEVRSTLADMVKRGVVKKTVTIHKHNKREIIKYEVA